MDIKEALQPQVEAHNTLTIQLDGIQDTKSTEYARLIRAQVDVETNMWILVSAYVGNDVVRLKEMIDFLPSSVVRTELRVRLIGLEGYKNA